MTRIILALATAVLVFLVGEARSPACGIKLTAKAPQVRGQTSPVGRVLLLGQSAQTLASRLEENGHSVELADAPGDAKRRRYRVVVADSNQVEVARERFPDATIVEQRGNRDQMVARVDSAMGRPIRSSAMARGTPIRTSDGRTPISAGPPPRRPRAAADRSARDERAAVAAASESPAPAVTAPDPEAPRRETTVAVAGERRRAPTAERGDGDELKERRGRPVRVVFFGNSSAALSSSTMAKLRRTARWLKSNADRAVMIEGHANTTGAPAANQALSEARADAVKQFLIEEGGVDASRIETAAFGMDRPAFSPGTNGKNRRVVIKIDGN